MLVAISELIVSILTVHAVYYYCSPCNEAMRFDTLIVLVTQRERRQADGICVIICSSWSFTNR